MQAKTSNFTKEEMKTLELIGQLEELATKDIADGANVCDHPCSVAVHLIQQRVKNLNNCRKWGRELEETVEQLQAENVLLREALESITKDYTFTHAIRYGDSAAAYSSTACEVLKATPQTAKVQAVIDAAIKLGEWFIKRGEQHTPCPYVGGLDLLNAVREYKRE